jgi:hypothetical protein
VRKSAGIAPTARHPPGADAISSAMSHDLVRPVLSASNSSDEDCDFTRHAECVYQARGKLARVSISSRLRRKTNLTK